MSDKHYVNDDLFSFSNNGLHKPISRVTLLLDDENVVTAGDDTGAELTADCPYATEALAQSLLAVIRGYQYQAYDAESANIDPAAELGDGVKASGVAGMLAYISDKGDGYPDIGAPGEREEEDEYPSGGYVTQAFDRKLAQTRSLIAKTAEEVEISVEELNGKYTALSVTLDGVTITDQDGTTKIKGSSIETDTLKVKAANIEGKLTASQVEITLEGAITWEQLSPEVQNEINDAYAMAEDAEAAAADAAETVDGWRYNGGTYIDGSMLKTGTVMASSLIGGEVTLLTAAEREAGGMDITGASTSTYAIELWSYGALRMEAYNGAAYLGSGDAHVHVEEDATAITNGNVGIELSDHVWIGGNMFPNSPDDYLCGNANYPWSAVWSTNGMCETSARRKKKNITYGLDRFDAFFDDMKGCSYQMVNGTSGRFHKGFIADDIRDNLAKHGISTMDFGGYVEDKDEDGNPVYALRYSEFIPLIVEQVQKLKARVARLEAKA